MKLKSRLMGVLIFLCIVVGMAFPTFAQLLTLEAKDGGGNVKTQFARGEDLYLHINLTNAAGVAGCAFTLNYPANLLTPPVTNADGLPVNSSDITSAFPFTQNSTPTHRENSVEGGKIYFAGVEIDTTDGGAKYGAGPITLFTVKLQVKANAAVGNFSLELTQTELFNPAAGYGQDNNSNGVYDAGDTKGKVPVLVGALDNGNPNFGGDLSDDFPILLGDQTQALATLQLVANDITGAVADELVLNYGVAYGLWHYDQTGGYKQWNTVNPSQMVTVDLNGDGTDELVAAFPGYGLYTYDSTNGWQLINTLIPEFMGAGRNNRIACDYGAAYGLWLWDLAVGWRQINSVDPEKMIVADIDGDGDDELVAGFSGYGLYSYDVPGVWTQINAVIPDAMVRYSNGVVCDFGATGGLSSYSKSEGWVQFNAADPDKIVAVDIDNDGQDELVVSSAGWGLYTYEPVGSIWVQINTVIPENMIRQGNGIAVDFGATYGLWYWDASGGWVERNTVDPGQMTVVDIDNDGVEELVVSFSGYGLYYHDETNGWQLLNTVLPVGMKPINFYP
jgi:hypothetical protein